MSTALNALFGSATRSAILGALLLRPEREVHLRELQREVGFSPRAVNKEVDRLTQAGFLIDRRSGNRRYLRANTEHPLYQPLHELLAKTVGVIPALRAALAEDPRIERALVYGSVASRSERPGSDVDLLIIGTITLGELLERVRRVETELNREINPVAMTPQEFQQRLSAREHLVTSILKGPHVDLLSRADDAQ